MGLSIKNAEVEHLARELAKLAGETLTEAVRKSLEERLEREKAKPGRRALKKELRAIRRRISDLPELDDRRAEEILGYDELGLPR